MGARLRAVEPARAARERLPGDGADEHASGDEEEPAHEDRDARRAGPVSEGQHRSHEEDDGADRDRASRDRRGWANTADDILWRRTKLGLHVPPEGASKLAEWLAGSRTLARAS